MIPDKDLGILRGENAKVFNSIRQNKCIHNNCTSQAILSHTFPENYLKNHFSKKVGGKYLVYAITPGKHYIENLNINKKVDSKDNIHFFECVTKNAGSLHLFCEKHDSNLFKSIDRVPFDSNIINEFLNFYRHFAYTYVLEKHFTKTHHHEYTNTALSKETRDLLYSATYFFDKFHQYERHHLENYLTKIHSVFEEDGSVSEKRIKSEFIIETFEVKENFPWCASGTTNFTLPQMSDELWFTIIIYPLPQGQSKITLVCDSSRGKDFSIVIKYLENEYNKHSPSNHNDFIALIQFISILSCKNYIIDYDYYTSPLHKKIIERLNHSVQLAGLGQYFENSDKDKSTHYKSIALSTIKDSPLVKKKEV